jgi:hypothetical protein
MIGVNNYRVIKNEFNLGKKMLNDNKMLKSLIINCTLIFTVLLFSSCNNEDNGLAPYSGSPLMSTIKVEQGTFKPKITWVGGYVSVIGVNKGSDAKLDSTLIWLVHSNSDQIEYPITFGDVPAQSQNLVSQYGGNAQDKLSEDNSYTYWLVKTDVWGKISSIKNKIMKADNSLSAGEIKVVDDTLKISSHSFTLANQNLDVFVNIGEVTSFGRFAKINIVPATDNNGPVVSWEIIQNGVTEQKISAIGLVKAQQYVALNSVWEMWSSEQTSDGFVYGKKDVISSPLNLGQNVDGTRTFLELPAEGISRNENYYLWIASSSWDQKNRTRTTNYYSYVTFKTN